MKIGKPKSKRTPVRLRHKIEKASAAKKKKDKKLAKKDPTWRSRLKKDPGIPNLFPYKDRILAEIEEKKQAKQQEIERRREEAKAAKRERQATDGDAVMDADEDGDEEVEIDSDDLDDEVEGMDEDDGNASANPMAALLSSARARAAKYEAEGGHQSREMEMSDEDDEEEEEGDGAQSSSRHDPSARAFKHLFPEVLSTADIILYVLDARDPQSTRSIPTERQIAAHAGGSKRLVLILNKIDLVPAQVLARWLTYLRRFHLTLPLRASTPAANAKTYEHKGLTTKSTAETLLKALKTYAAKQELKRALTVGVVGYPNVGKSSVINTLVSQLGRKKAPAPTGAEAGITTALRSVKLDNKLTLLDSPGVIFPATSSLTKEETENSKMNARITHEDSHARLVLLNAVPPKSIDDPIPAVNLLMKRIAALPDGLRTVEEYYGILPLVTVEGDFITDFLVQVARKRGRLGKGGVPNLNAAGMTVLGDWRDGRIGAWVEPPQLEVAGVSQSKTGDVSMEGGEQTDAQEEKDRKEIVTEWAKEFELEGLWGP